MDEQVGVPAPRRAMGYHVLRRGACAALAGALLTLLSSTAVAQSDQARADARAAATEGFQAFNAGKYEEALQLFKNAESLVHAPPHVLFMARASVKLGRLVQARELLRKLSLETIAPDAPGAFGRAQASAQQELPDIEARIPSVKLKVEGQVDDTVTVSMDGAQVPTAVLGVSRPIDPGEHKFQAKAKGMKSELMTVTIAEAAHETVVLKLVPAPDEPTPAAAVATAPAAATSNAPPQADTGPAASSDGSGMRIAAYVTAGVGVVGLGLGTVFALSSSSKRHDVDDLCKSGCPVSKRSEITSLNDSAGSAQTLSLVSFIAGGVALAAGGTLFYLSTRSSSESSGPEVHAYLGPGSAGLQGKF